MKPKDLRKLFSKMIDELDPCHNETTWVIIIHPAHWIKFKKKTHRGLQIVYSKHISFDVVNLCSLFSPNSYRSSLAVIDL